MEALGARIDLGPEAVGACIDEAGFGFMFAPAHHQATRFVMPVRRELAVRTIFNLLGPLTNPAGASRQLIGVSDARFQTNIAGALACLGAERALVVCSEAGLDEISTAAPTKVVEVNGEELDSYTLTPAEVGVPMLSGAALETDCAGGTPEQNAAVTTAILQPDGSSPESSASIDLALINAGAAIYVAGRAETIADGVQAARAALADGSAAGALERYVRFSQAHAPAQVAR